MRVVNRQPGFRPGTRRVLDGQGQEGIASVRTLKTSDSTRCVLSRHIRNREKCHCVTFFGGEKIVTREESGMRSALSYSVFANAI